MHLSLSRQKILESDFVFFLPFHLVILFRFYYHWGTSEAVEKRSSLPLLNLTNMS